MSKATNVQQLPFIWLMMAVLAMMAEASASSPAGGAVARGRSARAHGLQCERIAVPACQGLGYNMTALPNAAGHADQAEADVVLAQLYQLIESGCSRHIRFLVCATLFPLCTPDVSRPVAPCRSLCISVRDECSAAATPQPNATTSSPQSWPLFIDCDLLPQPERHELCMQVPQPETPVTAEPEILPPSLGDAPISDNAIPIADAGPHTSPAGGGSIWPWLSTHSLQPISGGGSGSGSSGAHSHPHSGGGGGSASLIPPIMSPVICAANFTPISAHRCAPQPGRDALFTPQQKRLAATWTLALAALCFILTLFSLVTFWAEPMRFGYPERPVLFLALCYNLISVAYLERAIFHQQLGAGLASQSTTSSSAAAASVANALQAASSSVAVGAGGGGLTCPASFLLVGYLQLAASAWWFLFAVCWYLSTVRRWSSEALERRATWLHMLAWGPPAVPPVAAILWDAVRPHELTGMCTARGFVELPAGVLLVAGAVGIVAASRSLGGLGRRQAEVGGQLAAAEGEAMGDLMDEMAMAAVQKRLGQIRRRIVLFSGVFFGPALAAVVLGSWETGYVEIEACVLGDPCVAPKGWPAWPTLLRLFVTLAGGSLAGMWVWSKKTCESYRSRMMVHSAEVVGQGQGRHHHHHHHHQAGGGGQVGGAAAYLVAPTSGKYRGGGATIVVGDAQKKKQPMAAMVSGGLGSQPLAAPAPQTIGPLYAGINFQNVPVYSVRTPDRVH